MPPHRYGWKNARPRLFAPKYHVPPHVLLTLPASVDLRPGMPAVYDQGNLGSCTANSAAGAVQYDQIKQRILSVMPSRLFVYYNERVIEGTVASDSGASIADSVEALHANGFCPEVEWPYDVNQFTAKPSQKCYMDALSWSISSYAQVAQDAGQIKGTLASGFPVMIGFTVYQSFESQAVEQSGVVPMPQRGEQTVGGHAVLLSGYDDARQAYLFRNSWGAGWGIAGYGWMPYAYVHSPQLASDFWVINALPGPTPPPQPPQPPVPGPDLFKVAADINTALDKLPKAQDAQRRIYVRLDLAKQTVNTVCANEQATTHMELVEPL